MNEYLGHEFSQGTYLDLKISIEALINLAQYHVHSSSKKLIRGQTRSKINAVGPWKYVSGNTIGNPVVWQFHELCFRPDVPPKYKGAKVGASEGSHAIY